MTIFNALNSATNCQRFPIEDTLLSAKRRLASGSALGCTEGCGSRACIQLKPSLHTFPKNRKTYPRHEAENLHLRRHYYADAHLILDDTSIVSTSSSSNRAQPQEKSERKAAAPPIRLCCTQKTHGHSRFAQRSECRFRYRMMPILTFPSNVFALESAIRGTDTTVSLIFIYFSPRFSFHTPAREHTLQIYLK